MAPDQRVPAPPEEGAPSSTPSSPTELEDAIFNLVVTLCRLLGGTYGDGPAREYVALYLERLAAGLRPEPDPTSP